MNRQFRQFMLGGLALLLLVPAAGCQTWRFEKTERAYVFPDTLANASFAPPRPRYSTWNPFAGGTPAAERTPDTQLAEAPAAKSDDSARKPKPSQTTTGATSGTPPDLNDKPGDTAFDAAVAAAFVEAVYAVNGVALAGMSRSKDRTPTIVELYQHAHKSGALYHAEAPAVGDLVFFHNTYDRNGDGRWNDWYTLVGVVEGADAEGTVRVLSYVNGQVQRLYVNQTQPDEATGPNGRLNTWLRDAEHSDKDNSGSAARLFAGYGNLLGDVKQVVVIDNWQPGMTTAAAE